jgi:hypothetical protein
VEQGHRIPKITQESTTINNIAIQKTTSIDAPSGRRRVAHLSLAAREIARCGSYAFVSFGALICSKGQEVLTAHKQQCRQHRSYRSKPLQIRQPSGCNTSTKIHQQCIFTSLDASSAYAYAHLFQKIPNTTRCYPIRCTKRINSPRPCTRIPNYQSAL